MSFICVTRLLQSSSLKAVAAQNRRSRCAHAGHKTIAAAFRCLRGHEMRPGIFEARIGAIVEMPGAKVVKRYSSSDMFGGRGNTLSIWARWEEVAEAPPEKLAEFDRLILEHLGAAPAAAGAQA